MGELHWKYLLHASNAIDTKVTKCLRTDCNKQGIKKKEGRFAKSISQIDKQTSHTRHSTAQAGTDIYPLCPSCMVPFYLSLYWEIVRDMLRNNIIESVSWRNWEQTKYFNQNFQPPADIWTRYLPNVNQTHTPHAMRELFTALLMETLWSLLGCDNV
jgi:UDP-galactopyranose mutase